MVDNSMNDDKWQGKKDTLRDWYEVNPEYATQQIITDGLFGLGDNSPEFRKVHWQSIANVFRGIINSPIHHGRQSLMEPRDKKYLTTYLDTLKVAYYEFYENISSIARPHGKSGLGLYNTMEDPAGSYAADEVKKVKAFLNSAFNGGAKKDTDKRFWMVFDSEGLPVITDNGVSSGGEEE